MKRRILIPAALALALMLTAGTAARAQTPSGSEQTLLGTVQTALAAKDWATAESAAKKLVALDPRWDYLGLLGDAQYGAAEYADAVESYNRALAAAPPAPNTPAVGGTLRPMLLHLGNSYLKLRRNDDAIAAYNREAAIDPNPGLAYFNVCAVMYNIGRTDGVPVCDKAIAADPTRADAYFVKASLLVAAAPVAGGKVTPLPGTIETLNKYLELAPNGPHAADVRAMLDLLK